MNDLSTPSGLAEYFRSALDGIRKAAAAVAPTWDYLIPIVVHLWGYLNRAATRFERIMAGGAPRPSRPRPLQPPVVPPSAEPVPPRPPRFRFPALRGWLGQIALEARQYLPRLQHMLAQPNFQAMARSDPRLGRIFRPLFWMLGVPPHEQPPEIRLPPRPARPRRPVSLPRRPPRQGRLPLGWFPLRGPRPFPS